MFNKDLDENENKDDLDQNEEEVILKPAQDILVEILKKLDIRYEGLVQQNSVNSLRLGLNNTQKDKIKEELAALEKEMADTQKKNDAKQREEENHVKFLTADLEKQKQKKQQLELEKEKTTAKRDDHKQANENTRKELNEERALITKKQDDIREKEGMIADLKKKNKDAEKDVAKATKLLDKEKKKFEDDNNDWN